LSGCHADELLNGKAIEVRAAAKHGVVEERGLVLAVVALRLAQLLPHLACALLDVILPKSPSVFFHWSMSGMDFKRLIMGITASPPGGTARLEYYMITFLRADYPS
jgi:hypothetical protein